MPEITLDNVQPLVTELQVNGRRLSVQFRCPVSHHVVPAQFTASPKQQNRVAKSAQRTVMYEVRRAIAPMLRGVFGHGMVGRMASQAADTAMRSATSTRGAHSGMSSSEQNTALVDAFRSVSSQFVWEAKGGRWMSARAARDLMSPFELQLADGPVDNGYDRQVLARMLVEIAGADGTLVQAERDFMTEFLTPEVGSVESLMDRPTLTGAELGSTTRGPVRGTLLLMATVLALSDEDFDAAEQQRLDEFSQGLGLAPAQAAAMREAGQGFLLDQALDRMFSWGGHDTHAREQMYLLADKIGLARDKAEIAEARFQRRRGV